MVLADLPVAVEQELGVVPLGQGKLGDAFIREVVLEVPDMDMFGILVHRFCLLSVQRYGLFLI